MPLAVAASHVYLVTPDLTLSGYQGALHLFRELVPCVEHGDRSQETESLMGTRTVPLDAQGVLDA